MRLKDKLIRKNCPACDSEITLGTSSLNKKINCPKCLQTVVIPNDAEAAHEKPAPKKAVAKEKQIDEKPAARSAPAKEPPAAREEPQIEFHIETRAEQRSSFQSRITVEEIHGKPEPVVAQVPEKRDVIYCLCGGTLRKCTERTACCCTPAVCIFDESPPPF